MSYNDLNTAYVAARQNEILAGTTTGRRARWANLAAGARGRRNPVSAVRHWIADGQL